MPKKGYTNLVIREMDNARLKICALSTETTQAKLIHDFITEFWKVLAFQLRKNQKLKRFTYDIKITISEYPTIVEQFSMPMSCSEALVDKEIEKRLKQNE